MKKIIYIIGVVFVVILAGGIYSFNISQNENDVVEESNEETNVDMKFTGIANPWAEVELEDAENYIGYKFALPENIENPVYLICESIEMVEIKFDLNGTSWNARVAKREEFNDISGLYYNWENDDLNKETTCRFGGLDGVHRVALDEGKYIVNNEFFDAERKLMYSICGETDNIDVEVPNYIFSWLLTD